MLLLLLVFSVKQIKDGRQCKEFNYLGLALLLALVRCSLHCTGMNRT